MSTVLSKRIGGYLKRQAVVQGQSLCSLSPERDVQEAEIEGCWGRTHRGINRRPCCQPLRARHGPKNNCALPCAEERSQQPLASSERKLRQKPARRFASDHRTVFQPRSDCRAYSPSIESIIRQITKHFIVHLSFVTIWGASESHERYKPH